MIEIGWEQPVYSTAKIALVVEALAAEGIRAQDALRGVDLPPDQLTSSNVLVSVDQVVRAYRNALRLTKNPDFAYQTGLRAHVSLYGMYGFAMLSSMNFRETMRFVVRYHQLATPLVKLQFVEEGAHAAWKVDPVPHPSIDTQLYRFIVEMQFGVHVSLHRDIMGAAFRPSAYHVVFEAPPSNSSSDSVFDCPILFRQPENEIIFDSAWLNGVPQLGNEITYSTVLSMCDELHDILQRRKGVAGKVRTFVLANLGRHASLAAAAGHFNTPVRTLRRRLTEEGTSFREILDQLRIEVAIKYLRDTQMTIDDIAHALGFSETSNFRQAFRRWKEASPQQFRQQFLTPSSNDHKD